MKDRRAQLLKVLLSLRQRAQEFARQSMALARADLDRIQATIARLDGAYRRQNDSVAMALRTGDRDEMLSYGHLEQGVRLARQGQKVLGEAASERLRERRAQLVGAMNRRKVVSRFFDRWSRRQASRAQRQRVRELDDLHATHAASRPPGWSDQSDLQEVPT